MQFHTKPKVFITVYIAVCLIVNNVYMTVYSVSISAYITVYELYISWTACQNKEKKADCWNKNGNV